MKQVKLFAVALTLLLGISLTSCLNTESDPIVTVPVYGECVNYYPPTFSMASGQQVVLSGTTETFTPGNMYFFYFQYDSTQQSAEAESITGTLYAGSTASDLTAKGSEGPISESSYSQANAPMFALSGYISVIYGGAGNIEPFVGFDNKWLFLPMAYWIKVVSDEDEQKIELDKHTFVLTYTLDEVKNGDTELVLTLNHVVADGSEENVERKSSYYAGLKAYNLSYAIYAFQGKAGVKPTRLKVVTKTNSSNDSLDGATESVWSCDIKD